MIRYFGKARYVRYFYRNFVHHSKWAIRFQKMEVEFRKQKSSLLYMNDQEIYWSKKCWLLLALFRFFQIIEIVKIHSKNSFSNSTNKNKKSLKTITNLGLINKKRSQFANKNISNSSERPLFHSSIQLNIRHTPSTINTKAILNTRNN